MPEGNWSIQEAMLQRVADALGTDPAMEQRRIFAKLDQLINLCDQLRARIGQVHQVRADLTHALVERAVTK